MADEEDLSKLPLATRWRHQKWKARQSAYEEVAASLADGSSSELPSQDELKSACSDANVIALESGIKVTIATLTVLNESQTKQAVAIRQAVATPLAEKGLVAAKPAVKQAALEALLKLVAVADPAGVVTDLLPFVSAKSPKAVTASLQASDAIFREFGSPVTDPKPVLKVLPNLFSHTDRNVRVAATNLSTSSCRWVSEPVILSVLDSLKPVQSNELKENFAKIDYVAKPPRLTQLQQAQLEQAEANRANNGDPNTGADDGTMIDADNAAPEQAADPWDYAEPQNVSGKIPANFYPQLNSTKWKERLEVLTSVTTMSSKAVRMDASGDYSQLVSELMRIASKDTNQMCAVQAITSLGYLAGGLRSGFAKYGSRTAESVIERFKERKQAAIDTIVKCLDEVFFRVMQSHFEPMLEILWPVGVKHKTPLVRLESVKYATHILCESTVPPKVNDIDMISKGCLKLLADTQETMRAAASALLAACIKIAGTQQLAPIMRSSDDHKRKRVEEALEATTTKCKSPPPAPVATRQANPANARPGPSKGLQPPSAAGRVTQQSHSAATGRPALSNHARPQPQTRSQLHGQPSQHSNAASHGAHPAHHPNTLQSRSNLAHTASSPLGRKNTSDLDTSMSSTSPSYLEPQPRESRPSISSTPKIVKRSFQRADFTPSREEAHRRRIYSPAKPQHSIDISPEKIVSEPNESSMREIARSSAQLNSEKTLRSDMEKQLARVQVDKDQEIIRLREESSTLRVQSQAQKEELRLWIQSEQRRTLSSSSGDDIGTRLSILSIGNDAITNSRPTTSIQASAQPTTSRAEPLSPSASHNVFNRVPSRHNNRVVPISLNSHSADMDDSDIQPPHRTGSDDWERAVSMTHSSKQRVEQSKQQKERTF